MGLERQCHNWRRIDQHGLGSFVPLLVLLGAVADWWKRSHVFILLQSDNGNEILLLCESSFLQFHYFLETEF
jgi:hypothetical protein